MRKKNILLAAAAVSLALSTGIGSAWAYFTTYTQARGGYPIELGDRTTVEEEFSDWTKHVVITSSPDSQPVYVRVRAISGSVYNLVYSGSGKWTPGADGYYYYSDIVTGGMSTDALDVRIENVPDDVDDPASFNVVIVYETTPVRYHEDGTPYADWEANLERASGRRASRI
ncbi:MAG: hypothetical protein HFH55_06500 [Lachnospiraceae bacterium]|nr:hypothetical protein [Lachnospiraceae bacterium]